MITMSWRHESWQRLVVHIVAKFRMVWHIWMKEYNTIVFLNSFWLELDKQTFARIFRLSTFPRQQLGNNIWIESLCRKMVITNSGVFPNYRHLCITIFLNSQCGLFSCRIILHALYNISRRDMRWNSIPDRLHWTYAFALSCSEKVILNRVRVQAFKIISSASYSSAPFEALDASFVNWNKLIRRRWPTGK